MNKELLEIYSDYLISAFDKTTATGLSLALDNKISHDKITRFLSSEDFSNKDLWILIKPIIREIENDEGVIIFDDTIIQKPYSEENDLICWHYDHTQNKSVKGINLLNCIYHYNGKTIPLSYDLIKKTVSYTDIKTDKIKRKSNTTKNEYVRKQLEQLESNKVKYHYVLTDNWFSCNKTMKYIHLGLEKEFIVSLKSNRLVALSEQDKKQGRYIQLNLLDWSAKKTVLGWLKGLDFPVLLHRQVFTNKNDSTGFLYLACSNINCSMNDIESIYQKRWQVEVFHKTLKSNTHIASSPAHTVRTQSNHIFVSIYSAFKLEVLKIKLHLNHFSIKQLLYLEAVKHSMLKLHSFASA